MKSRARNLSGNMQKLTPIEEIAVDLWTKIERDGADDNQRQPDWSQNGSRDAKRKIQNNAERAPKKLKPSMQTYAVVSAAVDQDSKLTNLCFICLHG